MAEPQVAPYGAWASPITTDLITAGRVALESPMVDGGDIYWLEGRATNQGRVTLVRRTNQGQVDDITGTDFNVRTRVHEYGGGAYTVADGIAYCSNFDDNRVYRIPVKNVAAQGEQRFAPTDSKPDAAPQPLTSDAALRYADLLLDRQRGRLICVREDHRDESREAINTMAPGRSGPPSWLASTLPAASLRYCATAARSRLTPAISPCRSRLSSPPRTA